MIESVGWLRVGRDEVPTEATRLVLDLLAPLRNRAYQAWVARYPDERGLWTQWHTLGAVGRFGRWHVLDFEVWSGFGRTLVPVMERRIRFDVAMDQADIVSAPFDPPLLHGSSRFLQESTLERLLDTNPSLAKGAYQKLLNGEAQLQREGLLDPAYAQTRSAWTNLLNRNRMRIEGELPGNVTLTRGVVPVSLWEVDGGFEVEEREREQRRSA